MRDNSDDFDRPVRRAPPITFVCPRHGTYSPNHRAHWQDVNICPACIETGKALLVPWRQAWDQFTRWQRTRVPARFRNRRFGNYRPTSKAGAQALAAAREVAAGRMQALALIGSVGTGKSHLAIGVLAEVVRAGRSGLWVHVPSLLREWRASFDRRGEATEEQLLDLLSAPDVLVLDEVGADRSEWALSTLSMLVDERYRSAGALIVTGNCATLAAGIGERGADRFDELGATVALTGPSYRAKAPDDPALQVPDDFTEPPARLAWIVCDAGADRIEAREHRPPGTNRHQELRL